MSDPSAIIEVAAPDLPGRHAARYCRRCSCFSGYLAQYVKINGQVAVRWVCDWCDDYGTAGDLPQDWVREFGITVDQLPKRVDRYDPEYVPPDKPPCCVCGGDGVCDHHWAPRSIFPDWPWELVAPLCQEHHDEWHRRMRAHGLRWPHELVA